MSQPQPHIFLSYSRHDTDMMIRVRASLQATGLTVWTDEMLRTGKSSWKREIANAIKSCVAFVVLLSPSAGKSKWVEREIDYAEKFEKDIIPVWIDGKEIDAVPFSLSSHQLIDFRDLNNYDIQINKLINDLYTYIGKKRETAQSGTEERLKTQTFDSAAINYALNPLPLTTNRDRWLTIAIWLPLGVPLFAGATNFIPYHYQILPFTPATWIGLLTIVVAGIFNVRDFRLQQKSHSIFLGVLAIAAAVALIFLGAGTVSSLPYSPENVAALAVDFAMLLPISLLSMISAFARILSYLRSNRPDNFRWHFDIAASCALTGVALTFPLGHITYSYLNLSVWLAIGVVFVASIFSGAAYFFAIYIATDHMEKRGNLIPRWFWLVYVFLWINLCWIYLLGGWKSFFQLFLNIRL